MFFFYFSLVCVCMRVFGGGHFNGYEGIQFCQILFGEDCVDCIN